MKYLAVLGLFVLAFSGCSKQTATLEQNTNAPASNEKKEKMETVIAHGSQEQQPPAMPASNMAGGAKSKWSQGGEPIDTSEMDNAIADAEKNVKAKPGDEAARKALGDAYFKRASALTDARQYAAALGDYRRALKNDPSNSEAKDWIAQIISIYDSMNKQYPPEGEEPPPLPFRKG
jgi:tetratricopeptide (TPR) repeat protein